MTEEARAVIKKARRSFGVSISILLFGFMALVGALVYRSAKDSPGDAERYGLESIAVPASGQVVSVVPAGDVLAVTFVLEGQTVLRLLDGKTGALIRDVPVVEEPPAPVFPD